MCTIRVHVLLTHQLQVLGHVNTKHLSMCVVAGRQNRRSFRFQFQMLSALLCSRPRFSSVESAPAENDKSKRHEYVNLLRCRSSLPYRSAERLPSAIAIANNRQSVGAMPTAKPGFEDAVLPARAGADADADAESRAYRPVPLVPPAARLDAPADGEDDTPWVRRTLDLSDLSSAADERLHGATQTQCVLCYYFVRWLMASGRELYVILLQYFTTKLLRARSEVVLSAVAVTD